MRAAGPAALLEQESALQCAENLRQDLVAAIREKRECPDDAEAHAAFFPRMKELPVRMGKKYLFQYGQRREKGRL